MKVLVLGASVSGVAAIGLAERLGSEVSVYDRDTRAVAPYAERGIETAAGDFDPSLLRGVDVVVSSPGIPEHGDVIQTVIRYGLPLWSELEFASRHTDVPMAAITGTNGKTTTTIATARMLEASGIRATAVGNIGHPLSDSVGQGDAALAVEASSFQLRFIDEFHPSAAAILNIAPDHLDWHGSMEEYVAAKARITENQTSDDIIVIDPDDHLSVGATTATRARLLPVSGSRRPDGGNGPEGTRLHIGGHDLARPPLDDAYLFDLTVAGTLAMHLGAPGDAIEQVMREFETADHRRSVVGTWDGVTWVNDSKATNPHAAAAAVAAYPAVVLIAGGRNKGLDLAPVVAPGSLRHVIAIGEAADELATLVSRGRLTMASSMRDAVAIAAEMARPGDTVLLAPACASFDMFADYVERGRVFTEDVKRFHGAATRGAS